MDSFWPSSALSNVLLPTFGRPMRATNPDLWFSSWMKSSAGFSASFHSLASASSCSLASFSAINVAIAASSSRSSSFLRFRRLQATTRPTRRFRQRFQSIDCLIGADVHGRQRRYIIEGRQLYDRDRDRTHMLHRTLYRWLGQQRSLFQNARPRVTRSSPQRRWDVRAYSLHEESQRTTVPVYFKNHDVLVDAQPGENILNVCFSSLMPSYVFRLSIDRSHTVVASKFQLVA